MSEKRTKEVVMCEQCIHSDLDVHDPQRTGEPPYNPHYRCLLFNHNVDAGDYCSRGELQSELSQEE